MIFNFSGGDDFDDDENKNNKNIFFYDIYFLYVWIIFFVQRVIKEIVTKKICC